MDRRQEKSCCWDVILKKGIGLKTQIESRSSNTQQSQNCTPQSHKLCHPVGFVNRTEIYSVVMKSKNAILKNLHYIHMVSITPKLFGGHGTGVPPLEPSQQTDTCLVPPLKIYWKAKYWPKSGAGFLGRSIQTRSHTDQEQPGGWWCSGSYPLLPPWLGQEGFGGSRGNASLPCTHWWAGGWACQAPGAQPSAQGSCLDMPRKTPCRDIIANKPNKKGFPITCTWDFQMCNGSMCAAPSTDYTPP